MISTTLLLLVVGLLATALGALRRSHRRQTRLEHDHRAMRLELERHRQTVQSILRELQ